MSRPPIWGIRPPSDTRTVHPTMSVGGGRVEVTTPYVGVGGAFRPKGSWSGIRATHRDTPDIRPQAEEVEISQAVDNTGVIRENPPIAATSVIHSRWKDRWITTRM